MATGAALGLRLGSGLGLGLRFRVRVKVWDRAWVICMYNKIGVHIYHSGFGLDLNRLKLHFQ